MSEPRQPEPIHLTPTRLWTVFVLVWITSILASGGVGWYFAGRAAESANDTLSKVVASQQLEAQASIDTLYTSDAKRCVEQASIRRISIHNARILATRAPGVIIPPPLAPCAKSVPDPRKPQPTRVG